MCGIVGFTGSRNPLLLKKLLSVIQHRGFDGTTIDYWNGINFGMNRLAIIDLNPNLYPVNFKHYQLIYNGEIYNHRYLRHLLLKKGVKFHTNSDAEVILPLFDLYGAKAFSKLEGMFAICIIDQRNNQIILARDKSGEKPLYFYHHSKQFVFASELKALLNYPNISRSLNLNALANYLHHGSIFSSQTLINKINKLLPSQYIVYDIPSRKLVIHQYWQPVIKDLPKLSPGQLKEQLHSLLKTSVDSRLLSDVPVGCFLSGGVDSSLISYLVAQKIPKLKTYSIVFPGFEKQDESKYSREVARFLQSDHTEVECTPASIKPVLENIGQYIDEPIMDPATLPTYLLAQTARKDVKVVLTGEGADELFAGYYRYHKELIYYHLRRLNQSLKPFSTIVKSPLSHHYPKIYSRLANYYTPQGTWSEKELRQLLKYEFRLDPALSGYSDLDSENPLLLLQLSDYRGYLAAQLLMKNDKLTMANNLEARAPFLDTNIINFGLSLPVNQKINGIYGKFLLRQVAADYLPKHIAWRTKHGFSLPLRYWFQHDLKDYTQQTASNMSTYSKLINLSWYQLQLSSHVNNSFDYKDKIWSLSILSQWLDYFHVTI
jgi:asparagine synthase (glutamine-hydrolysing)